MLQHEILEQEQSELLRAGFQPKRYGFLVKLIRRLIWPFVRPFHFFQLEKSHALEQKVNEISWLVKEIVLVRSELEALKNRYITLDSLDDDVVLVRSELEALKNRYTTLDSLGNKVAELNQKMGRPPSRELLITNTANGIFIGKPGEVISDFIINGGIWDSHIIEFADKVASDRKGGRAIDIGAHLGSTTIALAAIFDEVFSFEPNDFNFRVLRANVVINNLENVHLFNSGLYSHSASLSLGEQAKQEVDLSLNQWGDFDGHLASNLGAYLFSEGGSGFFEHSARTLDSYEFDNISFIKIDVQGADGEVLMGSLQTIRRCQPVIVFEWEEMLSRNFSITLDLVKRELGNLGYEIKPLKVHNEKQIDYVALPVVVRADSK